MDKMHFIPSVVIYIQKCEFMSSGCSFLYCGWAVLPLLWQMGFLTFHLVSLFFNQEILDESLPLHLLLMASKGDYLSILILCICLWNSYKIDGALWHLNLKILFLQCHNGHTLCSTCKTRVHNRCPTCRQELGDIRCLALEKVAESLELPCKYCSLGCPEIFPYYSKLKHEAVCNFRPYNCPYAGSDCSVVGDIPFLVAHLRDDHKVDMHSGCTFNHRYVKSNPREVENATWMLTVSIYVFPSACVCVCLIFSCEWNTDKVMLIWLL